MHRIPPILPVALVGLLAYLSLSQVRFSTSLFELLPQDLAEVRGLEVINWHFARDAQLVVTLAGDDAQAVEAGANSLAEALSQQTDLVASVQGEVSLDTLVDQGAGLVAWFWLNGEPDRLRALVEALSDSVERSSRIEETLSLLTDDVVAREAIVRGYDPLRLLEANEGGERNPSGEEGVPGQMEVMTSEDGTFRRLFVEGRGADFSDYRSAATWLAEIRELTEDWQRERRIGERSSEPLGIAFTGTPAFMAEIGAEMERDMTGSVVLTLLLISLLFWLIHRESKPLGWLVAAILLVLCITLNLGAWFLGDLSAASVGFAAILLGLAVDYGVILYREARAGDRSVQQIRRQVGPAIGWAAGTTAVVFLALNLSSLPGIAQMGNLVAMGIGVGAVVMLWGYLPVVRRLGRARKERTAVEEPAGEARSSGLPPQRLGFASGTALALAVLLPVLALVSVAIKGSPQMEAEFHPFRIRESPSLRAWREMDARLGGQQSITPVVVTASSLSELATRAQRGERAARELVEEGELLSAQLPVELLPNLVNQAANAAGIRDLALLADEVTGALRDAGFSDEGLLLSEGVFAAWERYGQTLTAPAGPRYVAPEGRLGQWVYSQVFSQRRGEFAALGAVRATEKLDREWIDQLDHEGVAVAGLGSLGTALNSRIHRDLLRVMLPMLGLLTVVLVLVFRCWRDVLLSLFSLAYAGAAMILLTLWTPLQWNSFNLFGLPLLLGTGLDYGIHMIFALRRNQGDVQQARHGIGRALLFCGVSTAIGFGSLAMASAEGLASLGYVCAAGILVNVTVAVWLLPRWYQRLHRGPSNQAVAGVGEEARVMPALSPRGEANPAAKSHCEGAVRR